MTKPTPADFPRPLFGCAFEHCKEEHTYPAEMLVWYGGSESVPKGFYCDECWNNDDALFHVKHSGPTLAQALERAGMGDVARWSYLGKGGLAKP